MKLTKILSLIVFTSLLMSCSNENPDTLKNNSPIVGKITYEQNVKSIINNNCISCHAATPVNGAPMSLVTYDQVKDAVLNRGLLNRISLENGNSLLMPSGGTRLPQETINIIMQWQQDGFLNQ